jgi:hypothetical protein
MTFGNLSLVSLSMALQPCTHSVGYLGRGISLSQGRYLHTEQHEHRLNAQRHPCLEWDSNSDPTVRASAATVIDIDRLVLRNKKVMRKPVLFPPSGNQVGTLESDRTTGFLDFVHRPLFKKVENATFRNEVIDLLRLALSN